jgi:hypothetical protein
VGFFGGGFGTFQPGEVGKLASFCTLFVVFKDDEEGGVSSQAGVDAEAEVKPK